MGEFSLDLLLPEGILKDAPILGPLFSCIQIGKSLHDRIFICKLETFLNCVDRNPEWKQRFSDIDECQHIAKQLLYIIDSSDDDKKLIIQQECKKTAEYASSIGWQENHFLLSEIIQVYLHYETALSYASIMLDSDIYNAINQKSTQ